MKNQRQEIPKRVYEMTTEELKEVLGDFERQYTEHQTGEIIHNQILGYEHEGVIEWCLETEMIAKKTGDGDEQDYYFLTMEGIEWQKKLNAYKELLVRRKYANEQSQIN